MAEKEQSSSVMKNPLLLGMIVLLGILVAGLGGVFYMMSSGTGTAGQGPLVKQAAEMEGLSQAISKHAAMAVTGNTGAFTALNSEKSRFEASISALSASRSSLPAQASTTLTQIETVWESMSPRIEAVAASSDTLAYLRETGADININLQLMQQENNKVVRALVRAGTAANEVVTAQRQALIVERMGHTIDRIVDRGSDQALSDQFTRDSQTFRVVLRGFVNGDTNLVLTAVTNPDVQANLARIDQLFSAVTNSAQTLIARSAELATMRDANSAVYAQSAELASLAGALSQSLANSTSSAPIASFEIGLGIIGAIVLVFIFITILVYRQSNSSVNETTQQNEENQSAILQLLDELADLADGDLRVQATVTESFTGAIADSINFSIDQMRALVSKINDTSGKVSSAADQTKNSVSALSEASQRQANEIADVSEAVNEMAVSIDMVSYNAAESSSVAERSVDIASKGAVVVQNTIDGMDNIRGQIQETAKRIKRLGESSQEIGDIVSLINDIADQTNILSLNAAIQASMAGDAGKGFAVVADEVQRLAERSGAAAKQISALVKTIQSDTNEAVSSMEQTTAEVVQGTRLAQDAGVALGEIEGVSKSLAEIIENISDAARQQAASAGKISNTMKSIQEITTATTDGTKETATAVGNLAEMTNELRSSVTGFKLPN